MGFCGRSGRCHEHLRLRAKNRDSSRPGGEVLERQIVRGTPRCRGLRSPASCRPGSSQPYCQPLEPRGQMDECEMHNREAFRDLAKLVNLKMFVDFGEFASACREHDPQKPPA